MRTILHLILLLLTCIPACVSDFKLVPQGDGIAIATCKITAQNGFHFSSTIPYLKRGKDGRAFEFIDARNELGPGFHGDHSADPSNSTILLATLTIRGYTTAEMVEDLICFATLSNDTEIQFPLLLEEPGNNSLRHPENREISPCVIILVIGIIAVVVVLVVLIPSVIVLIAVFVYKYIKRRKRSYQLEDVTQKQQSPESSYHTAGHDISLDVIQTEDTQENVQESDRTKF